MNRITVLSPDVVKKIAAGEVIERPASIVKELLENAVDAGAGSINIDIRGGGISYIHVADNGCGMDADDARLAIRRHATSKITHEQDLEDIHTLGFRGEALFSIAAVSVTEINTRPPGMENGTRILSRYGDIVAETPCACNEGTGITVSQVFSNLPARLKFLKSAHSEAMLVGEVVSRIITGHPGICVRFTSEGKLIYHSPGDGDLMSSVFTVFGQQAAQALIPVSVSSGGLSLEGYIGSPSAARHNRSGQHFFVNGRFVQYAGAASAAQQAYATRLMTRQYPFFVLFLQTEKGSVDVNVHPQKLQVRFSDENAVRDLIRSAVQDCLQKNERIIAAPAFNDGSISIAPPAEAQAVPPAVHTYTLPPRDDADLLREVILDRRIPPAAKAHVLREDPIVIPAVKAEPGTQQVDQQAFPADAGTKILGTAFETYVVAESGENLYFIDQHAAHERILYDRYMEEAASGKPASQRLLIPFVLHLSPHEFEAFAHLQAALLAVGFESEEFGGYSVRIHAVPHLLGQAQLAGFFQELLAKLDEMEKCTSAQAREENLIRMACHKAVKAGHSLKKEEIEALLKMFAARQTPLTCPHGRPIVLVMEKRALEKGFKRLI